MMFDKYCSAAAAILVAVVAAGCNRPTHSVLTELPPPPTTLGPPIRAVAPSVAAGQAEPTTQPAAADARSARPGWIPDVRELPWRYVVIHHSATDRGNAITFDKAHRQKGWDEMGYHFVITNGRGGPDGDVEIGSRWRKQKWGAHCDTPDNEYNDYGIGICLVGDFRRQLPTPEQLISLRELVDFVTARYTIRPENVIGHNQAPHANTECPGTKLLDYLARPPGQEMRP